MQDSVNLDEVIEFVIQAFNAHEVGKPICSDTTYDEKLALVKLHQPDFDVFEYSITAQGAEREHEVELEELHKVIVDDIDEYEERNEKGPRRNTWKFDGSSIVIYYKKIEGEVGVNELDHILSMGNKEIGKVQTEKFKHMVPCTVPGDVRAIRCEVLVDCKYYEDNARGKANGLVNSKYKPEEVDELVSLAAFRTYDMNDEVVRNYDQFKESLAGFNNVRPDGRPIFFVSPEVWETEYVEKGVARYKTDVIDISFTIDGIVVSEDPNAEDPDVSLAYKYDYILSERTTVEDISWRETDKEGYTSVLVVDEAEVDGKAIRNPSTNGVPKLIELGCGIGAEIEVGFAGATIPKVLNVIKKAPVTFPTCSCGYEMDEDDIYGAVLMCGNEKCEKKLARREEYRDSENPGELTMYDYIRTQLEEFLFEYLNLPRFNWENKMEEEWDDDDRKEMMEYLKNMDKDNIIRMIQENFGMSGLQQSIFELNIYSVMTVLGGMIKKAEAELPQSPSPSN